MAKKQASETPAAAEKTPAGPVTLTYVGPPDAESVRFGQLVPGRSYQESDPAFAAYLVSQHPEHWAQG